MKPFSDIRGLRAALLADRSLTGLDWCRAYAETVDGWLAQLFGGAAPTGGKGFALMAVGGHGRSRLAPGSDLDLVLVHDGRRKRVQQVADAVWYPIWDTGLRLDHSVRTAKELRTAMESDVKVALGWLDARTIAGDGEVAGRALAQAASLWETKGRRWLTELDQLTRQRHDRFGDLAFLLEPDVKEARGGLRDVQLLRSVSKVAAGLAEHVKDRKLRWAENTLASVRVELQRSGTQSTNVLLLQDQDLIAEVLGCGDADALMAEVADAARAISWASDDGWRTVSRWLAGPKPRRAGPELPLEPGIVLRGDEIALRPGADPAVDLSLALRAAAASAELDKPMARSTLDRLGARAMGPDGVWPPQVLQALLRLLGAGRSAVAAVESLDQRGVWLRYLPEWGPVRNRPQRNAYHRFTVDRHLLEAVAGASRLQSAVHRPDLLLLGALLHDIGKGQGVDHTDKGIEVVSGLAPRLGLPPHDAAVLVSLVRHHLLLADAATRRDLDDPSTASYVAAAVRDRDTLELLAALTEADSIATGPAAWGRWKAGLVARLVEQVASTLEGRPPPDTRQAALSKAERALIASGRLEVVFADRLLVAAPDQAGLLATVAGMLTLSGANVRSATTISDERTGMALLRFDVVPAFDELPDWSRFRSELAAALDGRLDVEARLVERDARYRRFAPSTAAYTPEVRVMLDNESSARSTIVEVRAPDRGPVLYRVTRALSAAGMTIRCALVSTLGAEAIDVFYVQKSAGGRIVDPALQALLRESVLSALGVGGAG